MNRPRPVLPCGCQRQVRWCPEAERLLAEIQKAAGSNRATLAWMAYEAHFKTKGNDNDNSNPDPETDPALTL